MNPVHVLISLYSGYGLGDSVQMTPVLKHLRRHCPSWVIDYCADEGRHDAAIGLVRNAIHYGMQRPAAYEREMEIHLYDTFCGWTDRPNTRVTQCLHDRFGIEWDPALASYEINITQAAMESAEAFMAPLLSNAGRGRLSRIVGIQYEGDSSQSRKNLSHEQADAICQSVKAMGRVPLLLDWRNRSPLPDGGTIHTTGRMAVSNAWGRSAQMNAAIISLCEAYIGIDSGPGKCASATKTPTLICWHGHHPALFHDPCPFTTHLVPVNHRDLDLLQGNHGVAEYFEKAYQWRPYVDLVGEVREWLKETLS